MTDPVYVELKHIQCLKCGITFTVEWPKDLRLIDRVLKIREAHRDMSPKCHLWHGPLHLRPVE